MPDLIAPTTDLHAAWLDSRDDWGRDAQQDGSGLRPEDELDSTAGFAAFVGRLQREGDVTVEPDPGRVHCTYRWIVEDGAVLGAISLRHELNDFLCRAGGHVGYGVRPSARRRGLASWALGRILDEARALGIGRVLVTCQDTNVGSQRLIESSRRCSRGHPRDRARADPPLLDHLVSVPNVTDGTPGGWSAPLVATRGRGRLEEGGLRRSAGPVALPEPGEAVMSSTLIRTAVITALVGGGLAASSAGSAGVGATGVVAAPPRAAATGWAAPRTLADEGTAQSAAMSRQGDLAVVWRSPDGWRLALRPAGSGWTAPAQVSQHATTAQVTYDGRGELVLAWSDARPGQASRVRARTLARDGGWRPADTVARRTHGTLSVAGLAANRQGTTVVAWQWWTDHGVTGSVSRGRAGGDWRTGLRTRDAVSMHVAIGDGGLAAALIQRATSDTSSSTVTLQVARQPRNREWGTRAVLQRLTDLGPPWPGAGGVSVDARGRTTVAWDDRAANGSWRIVAARAVQGEAWQAPKVLARRVGWGEFPVRVTGAQRGDVLVTYLPQPGNRTVRGVRWARPGWTQQVRIAGPGHYVCDWDVAMDPTGAAVALWTRSSGPGTAGKGVTVALMSTHGEWAASQRLSKAEAPDGRARVVAMSHGRAAAFWTQRVGDDFALRVRTHG